jgi:hypothetical protein
MAGESSQRNRHWLRRHALTRMIRFRWPALLASGSSLLAE